MIEVKKNNEISKEAISDSDSICKDYEYMRSYVTGGICSFSRSPGLDLFLKKGFLQWMHAKAEDRDYHKPFKEPEIKVEKQGCLPDGLESEMTMILANMILEERGGYVSVR